MNRRDRHPIIWPSINSNTNLNPNEDPVTGLERVNSLSNIRNNERRESRNRSLHLLNINQSSSNHNNSLNDHTLSEEFESLDYEIVENEFYRSAELTNEHQHNLFYQSLNRWVVCFLIGIFTASLAAFIDILIYYNSKLKFNFMINKLSNICEHQTIGYSGCMWTVLSAWSGYNCFLVGIASLLVLFVAPAAAGSGIPQIKCFLNGVRIPGVVRLKTLFVKSFGVICSVGGGLAAGKEGPMIHSGGVIAAGISQGRCTSIPIDFKIFHYFRNDREKRDFVSAGAAAGVSAAFSAPIGGVLFSLEEGASFWNQSLTWRMVFTAMISSFTLNCFLSFFYGKSGILSWSGLVNFGVFEDISYSIVDLPFFMIIGVFGGLFGSLFNFLNMRLSKFRKRYIKTKKQKFFECILVAVASAFTGFITLLFVNDCQAVGVNPHLTDVVKLWCPKGKYSAVANLFFQNPEESVKSLFHSPKNSFKPNTLLIFAIEYYLLTVWTFGISVPGGIFIPCLLSGAAWGRLFGIGVDYFFPNLINIHPGKYALAGAAAQLGGVVRMTISLTAILVEATKNITFGLPIMLVLMIAKFIGDLFNEGLYDEHINLSEIPLLGWHPPKLSRNILAENVMRKDVIALELIEKVGRIKEILCTTKHNGFPIVDYIDISTANIDYPEYGHLKGFILRSQLIILLKKRIFSSEYNGHNFYTQSESILFEDFYDDDYPRADKINVNYLSLTTEDENCWINLNDFLHVSPHRIPLKTSLDSIFSLFRGLGLRFLIVINDENKVRGIITRKDIARFKERKVKGKYLVHEIYISPYNN